MRKLTYYYSLDFSSTTPNSENSSNEQHNKTKAMLMTPERIISVLKANLNSTDTKRNIESNGLDQTGINSTSDVNKHDHLESITINTPNTTAPRRVSKIQINSFRRNR